MAVCRFNKFGFCRYGNLCFRKHENRKCENDNCQVKGCPYRHPRKCRYYIEYNNCKFGSYCKFSHDLIPLKKHNEEINDLKKQIKDLKKEIIEKDIELKKKDEEIDMIKNKVMLERDKVKEDEISNLREENKEFKKKVEELEKEGEKMKEENKTLMFKGMYFDIFKIEMREMYGHIEEDSEDDYIEEENDKDFKDSHENQGYKCDKCVFIGKSEAGLKTHRTVKHRAKSQSSSV